MTALCARAIMSARAPRVRVASSLVRVRSMKLLLQSLSRLSLRQKLIAGALLILVILTWLSVCVVLASYVVS